jgi:serine phosphatase RsbU (regulator of sigma subunit)/HAMP domain-containing protein
MDIAISESSGQTVIHFASTVYKANNEPAGVLLGTVRIDEIYRLMEDLSTGQSDARRLKVSWVDSDGILLYSNVSPEGVLKQKIGKFNLISAANEKGVNIIETDSEWMFVTKDSGYQNYEGSDWKLVLSISKADALLPATTLKSTLIMVMIGSWIVAIVLSLIAANSFVKPIKSLTNTAEEISKGNLKSQFNSDSKDEIGDLAKNLRSGTLFLLKRIDEQRVLNKKLRDKLAAMEGQKVDIEEIHQEVKDSIHYSQRIQKSILPDPAVLGRVFNDKMLVYRPKDVVSGDFYWFERVRTGRKEHMIIIAADCTGHGVPGAIMSMVGSNQLTNIVYYQNYLDAEKILARLDKAIKFELYRDMDEDQPRHDGMEVGVCVIDLDTMEMTFAGAGIPLYFIRDGQIEIYKSPKVTIGRMEGTEKEVEDQFTPMTFHLQKGDRVYLSSDGFQDQFGGPSDKRFMNKNFRNLLLVSGQDKSMSDQERKINQVFDHWKGNGEQTDDVLVLGFEV